MKTGSMLLKVMRESSLKSWGTGMCSGTKKYSKFAKKSKNLKSKGK